MTDAKANTRSNSWTLRLFTLMVWLAVGLCVTYWAFKFVTTKPVEATAALAAPAVVVDSKAVAKLLGATDNVAARPLNTLASNKFVLFGLASTARGQGVALIALDGKPAKPYRVGSMVADDLVLKSISKTNATLAASTSAPDGLKLELPVRKPGTLVANTNTNTNISPPPPPLAQAIAPVPNAANTSTTNAATAANAPLYANTTGTLSPALAESLRPTSRFAPRATANGNTSFPAMPATATSSSSGERN